MRNLLLGLIIVFSFPLFACDEEAGTLVISDPADGTDFSVQMKKYHPKKAGKVPAVFILPPIVGETILDRRLAEKFCANGISSYILNVIRVTTPEEDVRNLKIHDYSYQRALIGVRAVIAKLEQDPSIVPRFGILGMSLGGMLSAYVAGAEPKISASVIVVGAGNVAGVLSHSDQELVVKQRQDRMAFYGLKSIADYEQYLGMFVTEDPLMVAHKVRPQSMYLFIARSDSTVPTRFQNQLRSSVRDPLVFEMSGGHFEGIVKAGTIHSGKITRFLKNALR